MLLNGERVLHGSVVKCLTRNLGSWVRAALDPLGFHFLFYLFIYLFIHFFRGSVLGKDTSEPQPSTGEIQEKHE